MEGVVGCDRYEVGAVRGGREEFAATLYVCVQGGRRGRRVGGAGKRASLLLRRRPLPDDEPHEFEQERQRLVHPHPIGGGGGGELQPADEKQQHRHPSEADNRVAQVSAAAEARTVRGAGHAYLRVEKNKVFEPRALSSLAEVHLAIG